MSQSLVSLRRRVSSLRHRVSSLFDDAAPQTGAVRWFNAALASLIIVNVAAVILESVAELRRDYDPLFWWIEQIATAVFVIEYLLRLWTAVDIADGRYRDPVSGRLRYSLSFFALVDLVSILPAVLGVLGAADFRVLRLLRLVRMLKLTRHSTVFALLWSVVREEARSIGAILFSLGLTLTMSGALMYMIEGEAQPQLFSSIPVAMWWAIETLTTVGYGDIVPITPAGRLLGGAVSIIGIGTLALFSGVITVSFMDQLRMRRGRYRKLIEARLAAGPLSDAQLRELERFGDRLALSEGEEEEAVEEAIEDLARAEHCPHCGHELPPRRSPP
jgi:voltage-gated potassium channel